MQINAHGYILLGGIELYTLYNMNEAAAGSPEIELAIEQSVIRLQSNMYETNTMVSNSGKVVTVSLAK